MLGRVKWSIALCNAAINSYSIKSASYSLKSQTFNETSFPGGGAEVVVSRLHPFLSTWDGLGKSKRSTREGDTPSSPPPPPPLFWAGRDFSIKINREYYMGAHRYGISLRVFSSIAHEWAQRTSLSSWTLEEKFHVYKQPRIILLII